jgi:NAD(P)-dependent dehydrogenase (short-subunit alcohol dehydrogenase family)
MLTLITGASVGLGAEMARQLADLGHDLVLTARRVDRLEELRGEITARHPELRVEVAALDVTDEDQVFEVFRRFAPLERVIVNAGLRHSNIVGTGEHTNNLALARTNFVAAITQIEAAMEQFRAQGHGHLVVIPSWREGGACAEAGPDPSSSRQPLRLGLVGEPARNRRRGPARAHHEQLEPLTKSRGKRGKQGPPRFDESWGIDPAVGGRCAR